MSAEVKKKKLIGTAERPRMVVYRSLKHIYVQAVDDNAGRTLVALTSLAPEFRTQDLAKKAMSKLVGEAFAKKCLEASITKVVFDRNGRIYHKNNRLGMLADAARAAGLQF